MPQRPTNPSAIELDGPWTHHLYHSRGVRIHCADSGSPDAPLVLLVHGFAGGWFDWQSVLPLLAEDHHAVAIDLRGYGLSDKPPHGYDLGTTALDIAGLVLALGHTSATVVAHGESVPAAVIAGLTEPQRIKRVVALNPSHPRQNVDVVTRHPIRHRDRITLGVATRFPRLGERWLKADHSLFLEQIVAHLAGSAFQYSDSFDEYLSIRRFAMGVERVAYYACLRHRKAAVATMPRGTAQTVLADWSGWNEIECSTPPAVRVLHGAEDPLITASKTARETIADADHVTVVPGAGHYVHMEAPQAVRDTVLAVEEA